MITAVSTNNTQRTLQNQEKKTRTLIHVHNATYWLPVTQNNA